MEPATLNLTIRQGATFRQQLTWDTGDPATAVDLTGYVAHLQIRDDVGGTVLADMSSNTSYVAPVGAQGSIGLGGTTGTITLYLPASATAQLSFDSAVYDLKLTASTGDVFFLTKGKVKLVPQVTQ